MPREKRASQFAPFDALKGLREALQLVEWVLFDETTYSYYEKEVDAIYG